MRLLALAFTLLLAHFAVASAQMATPDTENGRYSFYPANRRTLTTNAMIFGSATASAEFKFVEALLFSLGLTALSVMVFVWGLGLPYPLIADFH
jgi:hypothetical protein